MNGKKILSLAVATSIVSMLQLSSATAFDRYHSRNNGNWVAPVIGGLIVGGIIAGSMYDPNYGYYRTCNQVPTYDQWGRFISYQTVCN